MRYTIILHPEDQGGYSVTVPALDGCVTQGETFEEAVENARDAIEGYIAVFKAEGWEIPVERHPIVTVGVEINVSMTESIAAA